MRADNVLDLSFWLSAKQGNRLDKFRLLFLQKGRQLENGHFNIVTTERGTGKVKK
jgi:hypothetical protein